jgi:hypothetical protein
VAEPHDLLQKASDPEGFPEPWAQLRDLTRLVEVPGLDICKTGSEGRFLQKPPGLQPRARFVTVAPKRGEDRRFPREARIGARDEPAEVEVPKGRSGDKPNESRRGQPVARVAGTHRVRQLAFQFGLSNCALSPSATSRATSVRWSADSDEGDVPSDVPVGQSDECRTEVGGEWLPLEGLSRRPPRRDRVGQRGEGGVGR